jgi:hypothetical protein
MSAIVMSPGTMRPYHPFHAFKTLALNLNCAVTKGIGLLVLVIILNSKEEWVANGIHGVQQLLSREILQIVGVDE